MKRSSRPSSPRRIASAAALALALAAAAPLAGAQRMDQSFDPANVNNRINDPAFQQQMRHSAQAIAENLVGRPANATDQRILGQFDQVQTQALNQIQNAMDRMPQQAGAGYGQPPLDARAIQQLQQSPEGRYVLEQMMAEQGRTRGNGAPAGQYPQPQYPQAPHGGDYDRKFREAYPDGFPGQGQGGYAPPQSSTGRALGGALLQDITNAAIQRSIGPRVQVQGNPYYAPQQGRRP